jgi:class 3 adenylate cyclase
MSHHEPRRGHRVPVEERWQITVLFADLVGFTTISERLGEEASYRLIRSIYPLLSQPVRDQGGVVKAFTGDGLMALFGFPPTAEHAPLHACRAALQIQARLATAVAPLEREHGVRPQLRIGINTGYAVLGQVDSETSDLMPLGDAAKRKQRVPAS